MIELTPEHIGSIVVDLLDGDLTAQRYASNALRAGELAATQHRQDATAAHEAALNAFARMTPVPNDTPALGADVNVTATLPIAVRAFVRARCADLRGVKAAWMKPDGTEVLMTGPVWTPELSDAGAQLVVDLRDRFAPTCEPLIEGGYMDAVQGVDSWIKVYP